MNTMKKILAFVMVVSMVLGCIVISTSAADTKAEYVEDGLIAWFDGSNNYNGEQNKIADLWKDLSGNANHISVADAYSRGEVEWTDNSLKFKEGGAYLRLPTAVVDVLESDAYTIEIVTGDLDYTATSYITLLSSPNDELSVFIRVHEEYAPGNPDQFTLEYKNNDDNIDENRPKMADAWDKFNSATVTLTSDLTVELDYPVNDGDHNMEKVPDQTTNVYMYSNGQILAKGKSQYNMSLDGYAYLGHNSDARAWSGDIYGLRIYDRALTAAEVAANAEADTINYRQGKTFAPTQEYDPKLDENYEGFAKLEGMTNNIIPFNSLTDVIPLTGFYGSVNLFDYMYPLESDTPWEGAKLSMPEDLETDVNGNTVTDVKFVVMYDSFCSRANVQALEATKANYVVFKLIVNGEFEDFNMTAVGYDADTQAEIDFATGSTFGGIDTDLEGEVQYLVYDIEGIFEDCEIVSKFKLTLSGMAADTEIYLLEMAMFQTEEQAEAYQNGLPIPEAPDTPETEPETDAPETDAPETDAPETEPKEESTTAKKEESTTAAPKTEEKGCASVVGFGAAAILVAAAAAVVLKKKD